MFSPGCLKWPSECLYQGKGNPGDTYGILTQTEADFIASSLLTRLTAYPTCFGRGNLRRGVRVKYGSLINGDTTSGNAKCVFVFSKRSTIQILTSAFSNLQEADGLILINIDNGSVTCSSDEDVDVPDMPLLAAQTFTQR